MVMITAVVAPRPRLSNFRVKIGGLALARGRDLEKAGRIHRARPWLLFAGLLSTYDLARAIARSRLRAFLQAFSLTLGLVASLLLSRVAGWEAWLIFAVGFTISAVDFALEVKSVREEDDGCLIMDLSGDVDRSRLVRQTVAGDDVIGFKSSYALYDREVNAELSRQSGPEAEGLTVARWSNDFSPLPAEVEKWRRQILLNRYRNAKANRPFNGDLVKQITSTDVILQNRDLSIEMRPTRYFDLMCSNYLTESYVENVKSGSRVLDGVDLIRDTGGRLPRLESSDLANAIGVCTLAFDSRKKLILVQQSEFAQSSRNLWSPSGSGSLEPADVHKTLPRHDSGIALVDVIRRGMNRELIEESHIPEDAIVDSRVIAYFRWLNKGAKPEYVGVTLLDRPVTQLRRRMSEFRWVRGIEVGVTVNFTRLQEDPAAVQDCLGNDATQRERFGNRLSFPLYMALRALGERLREESEFRHWLLAR